MTPATLDTITSLKRPIQQWTRGWMLTPGSDILAQRLGFQEGQHFWIVGRAGVLGDCDADVATGGLAFVAPDLVRAAWDKLPTGLTPRAASAEYATLIHRWGDAELTRFDHSDLQRLDDLARRVIHAAPSSLGAVFAGWRSMPIPDGLNARVALTMHVLREMRGAAHITAVIATRLTPLQAVLASPAPPPRSGPAWAEHLGWTGPFEDPEPLRARRDAAEQLTNELLIDSFDTLDRNELRHLGALVVGIREQIDL
jgi:hypothetical protein